MISRLFYVIFGFVRAVVPFDLKEELLECFVLNKIRFRRERIEENGDYSYEVFLPHYVKYLKRSDMGASLSVKKTSGLPRLIGKYGKRWGVLVGIVLFSVIVWLSTRFVWYIDVKGNTTVADSEIIANLEEMGFTYGTNFNKIDFDVLCNKYLSTYDDLCWIFINMEGTHAHVEVRELVDYKNENSDSVKNIVASEAGTIVLVRAKEGKPMVKVGDKVAKGDLILSGIICVADDTVRFECSGGEVFAEVLREFTVIVPKFREKKHYTGEYFEKKELIFLKNRIKLFGNYGISYTNYDTINRRKQISLFGEAQLPIFIETKRFSEYTLVREELAQHELEAEKKRLLSKGIKEALSGGELLNVEYTEEETQDEVIFHCSISCIADIAEPVTVGDENTTE